MMTLTRLPDDRPAARAASAALARRRRRSVKPSPAAMPKPSWRKSRRPSPAQLYRIRLMCRKRRKDGRGDAALIQVRLHPEPIEFIAIIRAGDFSRRDSLDRATEPANRHTMWHASAALRVNLSKRILLHPITARRRSVCRSQFRNSAPKMVVP